MMIEKIAKQSNVPSQYVMYSSTYFGLSEEKSTVEVIAKGKTVNAKSIMGIMSLGLGQGDELTVVANGEDQEAAVNALVELIEGGFGE